MTDLAAAAPSDSDGCADGDPAGAFRRAIETARKSFRQSLLRVVALSPEETEDVLKGFDSAVMSIADALVDQALVASAEASGATGRARVLELVRDTD